MQSLFEKRFDAFKRALAGVQSWDAEAIHESRIGSRRLRELVPILGLDHGLQRKLGRQLRRVTRRLGAVREADVLTRILSQLEREGCDRRIIEHVSQVIGEEAREARESVRHRFDERDRERLIEALTRVARELTARKPNGRNRGVVRPASQRSAIDARVARRASRLALAIGDAGALYAPEALHGVRVALKKLRYALEVFNEARGQDDPKMMTLLRKMQQTLGRLHDLEMLGKRVHRAEEYADTSVLAGLAMVTDRIDVECRELHAEFMKGRATLAEIAERLSKPTANSVSKSRRPGRPTSARRRAANSHH